MLPVRIKLGAAMPFRLADTHLLGVSCEGRWLISEYPAFHAGVQYSYSGILGTILSARAGIKSRQDQLGILSNLSLGAGITFAKMTIDYAWSPEGNLGLNVHQVGLKFQF